MKKLFALLAVLAITACTNTNPNSGDGIVKADESSTSTNDPTPPLWKYILFVINSHPDHGDNLETARHICEDFKTWLEKTPNAFDMSAFKLESVSEENGKTLVNFVLDVDSVSLHVRCSDFDRDKAIGLMGNEHFIIRGFKMERYKPAGNVTSGWLNLGDVYVKDLQVEAVD